MRLLLIDNYDSYTYNLAQLLAGVTGVEPLVLLNDDPAYFTLDLKEFGAIVISPGPGHPGVERDFGCSALACRQREVPVLGVCLGHQGLALSAGARVSRAPQPRHGHLSRIQHVGEGIFRDIPQGFTAVRYHSLCVQEPLPPELVGLAWAEDGVLMALRHRVLPLFGVQFHPESFCTAHGSRLLDNFLRQHSLPAGQPIPGQQVAGNTPPASRVTDPSLPSTAPTPPVSSSITPLQLVCRELPFEAALDRVYAQLYRHREHVFWLDSARIAPDTGRFSFLGSPAAPNGEVGEILSYRCGEGGVVAARGHERSFTRGSLWSVLDARLSRTVLDAASLPFAMCGGYVGYFGYELKAELGASARHRANQPDAMFMQACRFVAVDHLAQRTYVVALAESHAIADARQWVELHANAVAEAVRRPVLHRAQGGLANSGCPELLAQAMNVRQSYCAAVSRAQGYLHAGESYEVCLTHRFYLPAPQDELEHYLCLRRDNPAPYAALLRAPGLSIHSASPECFLRVDRQGYVQSRPIKGTAPRDADPERDREIRARLATEDKTRAENLMICDLLRNDLGRVCRTGSVHVPRFMEVESYATVHQLVTTVAGQLRPNLRALDAVQACFPGGSMTGAPKLRTMEIIDQLETNARGVYSGSLGYLTYDGAADLSIVIRTAVRSGGEWTVGAGGAVVLASDPRAEFEEMLLKARVAAQGLRTLPHT